MFKNTLYKNDTDDPHQSGSPSLWGATHSYDVQILTRADIPAFLKLQRIVRETLPEGQKHHLKERLAKDLEQHMDAGMPVLGIKDVHGAVVAQALMTFPENAAAKNTDAYPIQGIEERIALVQSLAIHPDFRGKGFITKIHVEYARLAQLHKRDFLMAKVADSNPVSQKRFLDEGYFKASEGLDPQKGYAASYFIKVVGANSLCTAQQLPGWPTVKI